MHDRSDYHVARRLFHVICGLVPALAYRSPADLEWLIPLCIAGTLALGLAEVSRFVFPEFNRWALKTFGGILRKEEKRRIHAAVYYVIAVGITLAAFPRRIALLAILFLAFADPIASWVGITWKRFRSHPTKGKTLAGTIGAALACWGVGLIFFWVDSIPVAWSSEFAIVGVGALAASLSERFPWLVDDNLSIPLISGFSVWLMTLAIQVNL